MRKPETWDPTTRVNIRDTPDQVTRKTSLFVRFASDPNVGLAIERRKLCFAQSSFKAIESFAMWNRIVRENLFLPFPVSYTHRSRSLSSLSDFAYFFMISRIDLLDAREFN